MVQSHRTLWTRRTQKAIASLISRILCDDDCFGGVAKIRRAELLVHLIDYARTETAKDTETPLREINHLLAKNPIIQDELREKLLDPKNQSNFFYDNLTTWIVGWAQRIKKMGRVRADGMNTTFQLVNDFEKFKERGTALKASPTKMKTSTPKSPSAEGRSVSELVARFLNLGKKV